MSWLVHELNDIYVKDLTRPRASMEFQMVEQYHNVVSWLGNAVYKDTLQGDPGSNGTRGDVGVSWFDFGSFGRSGYYSQKSKLTKHC